MVRIKGEPEIWEKCGTPGYIAPEVQTKQAEQSFWHVKKADYWSLGVLIYQVLFKRLPFPNPMWKKDTKLPAVDYTIPAELLLRPGWNEAEA